MTIKLSQTAREYLAIPAPAMLPDAARPAFDAYRMAYAVFLTRLVTPDATDAELARLGEERDAAYSAYCAALARAKTQPTE